MLPSLFSAGAGAGPPPPLESDRLALLRELQVCRVKLLAAGTAVEDLGHSPFKVIDSAPMKTGRPSNFDMHSLLFTGKSKP